MLLSKATEQYLDWRRNNGYAVNTVRVDRVALGRLAQVAGNIHVNRINHGHIDAVFALMGELRLKPPTVNATHACLASFLRWARSRNLHPIDSNPMGDRRYRPCRPPEMVRVPLGKFPALLDAAASPRDRMLIALGLYTMGRAGEITGIRMRDVDLASGEITMIIHKTHEEDRIPISKELRRELVAWLPYYEAQVGPLKPDYYLAPASRGGRWEAARTLIPTRKMGVPEDAVKRALSAIGIEGYHTGMHVLRRSAARARFDEMAALGYDGALRRVSAWLHHRSVMMTEIYLGLNLDRAQRDKDTKDQPLYPSLEADNVLQMKRKGEDGEADAVGL